MEPNDAAGTAASSSVRAQEMRASLGARREVEALLAEASATREAAVADADAIIEEAQQLSDQLLRESRTEAERTTTDARLRAEGVVARARAEAEEITRQARAAADAVRARAEAQVEEYRRRVRAELTEQVSRELAEQSRREMARVHERQQSMIGDIEASVRILGVSMESATANISEMLGALDSLRNHTAESLGEATVPLTAPPRHAEAAEHVPAGETTGETTGEPAGEPAGETTGEPAGEAAAEATAETAETAETGEGAGDTDEGEQDEDEADRGATRTVRSGHLVDVLAELDQRAGDDPPGSAMEAFLLSAHIDHGDPPLPPTDDTEVGARYARDAMRATARARARRDQDAREVPSERDPEPRQGHDERTAGEGAAGSEDQEAEGSGKPLGWLFRSSS